MTLSQPNALIGVGAGIGLPGGAYTTSVSSITNNADGTETVTFSAPLTATSGNGIDTGTYSNGNLTLTTATAGSISAGMTIIGSGIPAGVTVNTIKADNSGNITGITAVDSKGNPYTIPDGTNFAIFSDSTINYSRFAVTNNGSITSNTLVTTGALAGWTVGMTVTGTGVVVPGTTVTAISKSTDPTTGDPVYTITLSNQIILPLATDLKAGFTPVVATGGNQVVIVPSLNGLAVGETLIGIGIAPNTTITGINSATNAITLSSPLSAAALNQIANGSLVLSVDTVTGTPGPNQVTLSSVAGYKIGYGITGDPSIPANAVITAIDPTTKTITYTLKPTSPGTGGSMNNLTFGGAPGSTGLNGITGSTFGTVDAGEGLTGTNGTNGAAGSNGPGGMGGNGGVGSNGQTTNPTLAVSFTVDTVNLIGAIFAMIGTGGNLFDFTLGAAIFADQLAVFSDITSLVYVSVQVGKWQTDAENGLLAPGGNGGFGGNGGAGSDFFGGGPGGVGGNGGTPGYAVGIGGTAGSGGVGGAGGFGAGGGSGGAAGAPGPNGDYADNGTVGAAGFGGGTGDSPNTAGQNAQGGQGGSGYGGAIFVRNGGTLNISGNAVFQNNAAFAGGSSNGGASGQSAGNDLFMMTGSNVSLTPGVGNTITFYDSIADDSSASIGGSSIAAGQGASLTIGGGGTVQLFGTDTYTGTTYITGATLEAADGSGVNASSHVLFSGQGTIGDLNSTNAGVWLLGNADTMTTETRPVGLQPNDVSWTDGISNFGSGGFAALAGGLTLNLGSINGGIGPTLTWNKGGFVTDNYTLVFGSDATDATGTVTLDNAINLSAQNGMIAVYHNSGSTTDGISTFDATLAGVISGGSLTVGSAGYVGSLFLSGKDSLTALTVNAGIVSDTNGTTTGRLFDAGTGGALTINGGMVMLGGTEKLTTVTVAPNGILGASGAITTGDITNNGIMVFGNTLNANSITNYGALKLKGVTTLYGLFNNESNGTVIQTGAISGAVGASVSNSGVWDMAADINATGAFANSGTLNVIGTITGTAPNQIETAATRTINTTGFSGTGGTVNLGGITGLIANTLVINQSNTTIYSGAFTGAGNLTKAGTGTLHLAGANTFTGALTIDAGGLAIDSGGTLASTLNVTVGTSSTPTAFADFSVASTVTINSITNYSMVQDTGTLSLATLTNESDGTATVSGTGSLIASGAVSNAGSLTFNSGTTGTLKSTLDNSGTLSSQGTLKVSALFTNETGATTTLGSSSTPNVGTTTLDSLTNNGTVTSYAPLTVTNAVINTGTMTLNDPSFGSLTNSGTINLNANLTVTGAYVQNTGSPTSTLTTSNNANLSTGSFSGTGGSVVLNGSSLFTITQTADGTYSGSVSGTGTVTKIGSATLTLAGAADSFAPSAITINAGAVKVVNASILDSGLAVTTGSTGILSLLADQSIASLLNNSYTNLVANLTTSGTVTDNGTLNVVGKLIGTPVVETAATRTLTTAGFAGDGTVNLGGTTGSVANTLIINQSGDSIFTGSFTGGGGLTKTGAGDLNLQAASSFTGPLAINGGKLDTTNGGTFASTTDVTVGSAGTFIVGTDDTIKSITNNGVTTVNANLGLTTFTNDATGTATVNGSLTASGAVSNAGSLTFASGTTETLKTTLDNSGTLTSQGTLGVTGLFTNEADATATLGSNGSSTFGSLTNNGTINATANFTVTGLATNTGTITAAGFSGGSLTNSGSITSSSLINISGAYIQNGGSLNVNGGLSTGSLSGSGGHIYLNATGPSTVSAYVLNQTTDGSFAGTISGVGVVYKEGAANLTLTGGVDSFAPSALNIYAGQVIVANADILDHALNVTIGNGTLPTTAALTLEANQTIHDLSGDGALNLNGNTLTLASGGDFTGPITGSGGVQVSQGTFTLNSGSTIVTATLNVNNGQLNLIGTATTNSTDVTNGGVLHLGNGVDIGLSGSQGGTLNSTTVLINDGGTLTGNGTVNGTILVGGSTPGTVAPGNSPGLLTVGNITYGNLATAAMQIDGTAGAGVTGGNDQVVVTGKLVLQPGSALAITKSQPASGFQFALAQQVQLFKFAPGAVSGYFGAATLSSDFNNDVIFNVPTGSVIGLGSYTPASFTTAVANTRNETAILNAMLVNTAGGVNQYYGGNLLPYLTNALASSTPGATDAAFNRWSPEGYAGIVDQMKLAVLDNLPDLSSYDTLKAGRSYAFGNMGTSGMDGTNRAGFTQSKFKDTAMNVGLAHQFSMVELSLSYGHSDGTYHSALMQGTVLGNQVFAGASAPLALGERLRVTALASYSDFSSHGTRSTNSGTADFGGVKSKTTAYGFGLAYHQPGATRIDVSAQVIGMSESLDGFTEFGAASNAAGTLDLMHVGETHHQAWVAQLDARVTRDITRHLEGYVAAHYDGELGAQYTPITGNVAVESVNYTVINPGLARNRASGEAGLKLHITPTLDLDAHAKGGTDAAYNFGGGLRLSF